MPSLKVMLISTGVLSMAVILKLSLPAIMAFSFSGVPSIWTFFVSCLKPPYLYIVINCIIIIIVASSKLQPKHRQSLPEIPVLFQTELIKFQKEDYTDLMNEVSPKVGYANIPKVPDLDIHEAKNAAMDSSNKINGSRNEVVVSKSSWMDVKTDQTDDHYLLSIEKPPVSARFGHRKTVKAIPEGGKTLGVSKPKRQDTLESTWKTITDGRPMPLTRHARKSEAWDTFNDRNIITSSIKANNSSLARLPNSGKLRKEASPGQEELNRRVEAFINKFNEDMRMQRQESLNQYMEMINRGAH